MSQVIEYSEKVMDHFKNPRNVGEIENASGVGTVGNAKCGDIMRIYLDIDENQVIRDVKFKTFGCGAAVATSSIATEMIMGKTVEDALKLTNEQIAGILEGKPVTIDVEGTAVELNAEKVLVERTEKDDKTSENRIYAVSRTACADPVLPADYRNAYPAPAEL